jgi:D-alanyl-lipoteichoic acid acyltransferase DltB (MBOAT superfamily)
MFSKIILFILYPVVAPITFFQSIAPIVEKGIQEASEKANKENSQLLFGFSLLFLFIYLLPLTLIPFAYGFSVLGVFIYIINFIMSLFYEGPPPLNHLLCAVTIIFGIFGYFTYKESKKEISSSSSDEA